MVIKSNELKCQIHYVNILPECYRILQFNRTDSVILKNKVKEVDIYKVNEMGKKKLLVVNNYNKNGLLDKRVEYYMGNLSDSLVYYVNRKNTNETQVKIFLGENAINEVDDYFTDKDAFDGFKNWYVFAPIFDSSIMYKKNMIDIDYLMDKDSNTLGVVYVNNIKLDSGYWEYHSYPDTIAKNITDTAYSKDTMIIRGFPKVQMSGSLDTFKYQEYYLNNLLVKGEDYRPYNTLREMQTYKYDKRNRLIEYFFYEYYDGKFIKDTSEQINYDDSAGKKTEVESEWNTFPVNSINSIYTKEYDNLNHLVKSSYHKYNEGVYEPRESEGININIYNSQGLLIEESFYDDDILRNEKKYEYKFW
jgi:hypothetical protein